jgi:hypothetical protein
MNRKLIAIPAITLAAGLSLAACGSDPAPSGAAARPAITHTVTAAPATPAAATTAPAQVVINNNAPAAPATPPPPQTVYVPAPGGPTDPWAVISAYYGDIESGDYTGAWNMGSQAFMDQNGDNYAAFEAGYADTGTQTLTEVSEYGDTVTVDLAAVDTATGLTQYFTGSFTVDDGLITSGSLTQTG